MIPLLPMIRKGCSITKCLEFQSYTSCVILSSDTQDPKKYISPIGISILITFYATGQEEYPVMVIHLHDLNAIHLALGLGAGINEGPVPIPIQGEVKELQLLLDRHLTEQR